METTESIRSAYEAITARIAACGVDPTTVAICGVTKTFDAQLVRAASRVTTLLGENYASELVDKAAATRDLDISWQFLGPIQRNKIAKLAPVVHRWQSVARLVEGIAIAKAAPRARVLIQVDTTELVQRNGVRLDDVAPLVDQLGELGLTVEGLMTVAPVDPEGARRCFAAVREACDTLALPICSMGMTDDLELAVGAGSTMVRIGRALFGSREESKRA